MDNITQPLFLAAAGGLMYDCMVLYLDYKLPKENRVEKDFWFCFFMCVWPLAGVVLTYAYIISGSLINGFPALITGFTASTTFQTLMDQSAKNILSDNAPTE